MLVPKPLDEGAHDPRLGHGKKRPSGMVANFAVRTSTITKG
jgi:hypothetical protein